MSALFADTNVQALALYLSKAKNPIDVVDCWQNLLKGNYPELSAIVSLPDSDRKIYDSAKIRDGAAYKKYLVSYFSSTKLYYVSDEIINAIHKHKRVRFLVDHTLSFDTNFARPIKNIIKGERIKGFEGYHGYQGHKVRDQSEMIQIIDHLLCDDLNFDYIFYLLENIKKVYPIIVKLKDKKNISPLQFWNMLDKKFKWNLVSLELFRSLDRIKYLQTMSPQSKHTFPQAAKKALRFAHAFYLSNPKIIDEALRSQKHLLLCLIGIYKIQFSSEKGERKKTEYFFDYMQNIIKTYMDREAILAYKYFAEMKNIPFLTQINQGRPAKNLLGRLDNMAWDMAVPRVLLESVIKTNSDNHFMVPYFLTFDVKLKQLLNTYPVKAMIIDKQKNAAIPVPEVNSADFFYNNGCGYIVEDFFSEAKKAKRRKRNLPSLAYVDRLIGREYKDLEKIMYKKK